MRLEDEKNIEQLRAKAVVLASENQRMSKKLVELLKENLSLKGMTAVQLEQALGQLDKGAESGEVGHGELTLDRATG